MGQGAHTSAQGYVFFIKIHDGKVSSGKPSFPIAGGLD